MKTILPLASLALVLFAPMSGAQTTSTRLLPTGAMPGEFAGRFPGAVAVGGGRIALGSPSARDPQGRQTGAVYLFDERSGRALPTLYPPAEMTGSEFGHAIAISGRFLAVGAPKAASNGHAQTGVVLVFDLTTRRLVQRLGDGVFFTDEQAGMALAMEGDLLAIGAPYANFGRGHASGAVLLWRLGDNLPGGLILHPDGEAMDTFGYAVALEGGLLAVGVPKDRIGGEVGAGSVQLFDTASLRHLAGVNGAAGNGLGATVALSGNLLVAGAPSASMSRGKVSAWGLQKVTAPVLLGSAAGETEGERLGSALSVSQGLIAIGAPGSGTGGKVRFFNGSMMPAQGALEPFDLAAADGFGSALAFGPQALAVTAPGDDRRLPDAGAVWSVKRLTLMAEHHLASWSMTSGEPVTGVFGATHGKLREVVGTMSAPATLGGLNGAGRSTTGLWSDLTPGRLHRMTARTGELDAFGRQFTRFSGLLPHFTREVLYLRARAAGVGVSASRSESVQRFDSASGRLQTLLEAGGLLPDGSQVKALGEARLSNGRDILALTTSLRRGSGWPLVTATSDSALVLAVDGRVAVALREGVDAAPIGSVYGQMPRTYAVAGDRGFGVFSAQATMGSGVSPMDNVFVMNNALVAARKGSVALNEHGLAIGAFSSFNGACGDDAGVVFRATLRRAPGVSSANNEGLWCQRGGDTRLLLRKGQSAPVVGGGATVRRILRHGMNRAGHVLVLAQLGGHGVSRANDLALYWNRDDGTPGGEFQLLLRESDVAPGTGGARVGRIVDVDFTSAPDFANSHYGALVTLAHQAGAANATNDLVWLAGSAAIETPRDSAAARRPVMLLRKGALYAQNGRLETVRSLAAGTVLAGADGCLNSGRAHVLGAYFGRSTLRVTLSGGRQAAVAVDR